jgi:hypothetical protein
MRIAPSRNSPMIMVAMNLSRLMSFACQEKYITSPDTEPCRDLDILRHYGNVRCCRHREGIDRRLREAILLRHY